VAKKTKELSKDEYISVLEKKVKSLSKANDKYKNDIADLKEANEVLNYEFKFAIAKIESLSKGKTPPKKGK
jgi:prefoldin subunit 5